MVIEPQAVRYRSELTPEGFRIVIPVRRNWFILLFICAWLGGWVFGESSASRQLIAGSDRTPVAFLSFWLLAWTMGGVFALATVLWQLAGREILTISPTIFSYRAEAFGLGRTRSYRAADVRALRLSAYSASYFTQQRNWLPPIVGSGFGPIAFDYGARTFRFAPSLDEAEAKLLINDLAPRLPNGVG